MTERREPAAHPIRDLLAFWDGLYTKHMGLAYPFNGGRDSKMMKDLRQTYTDDQIRTFMAAYFEMDDPFIEQGGHSLAIFRGCLPKIIQFVRQGQKKEIPKNLQGIAEWMHKRAGNE